MPPVNHPYDAKLLNDLRKELAEREMQAELHGQLRTALRQQIAAIENQGACDAHCGGVVMQAQGCCATVPDLPQVTQQMQGLSYSIGECFDALCLLEQRLDPVLTPENPADSKGAGSCPEPLRSAHAAEIAGSAQCIDQITSRLRHLLRSLEI